MIVQKATFHREPHYSKFKRLDASRNHVLSDIQFGFVSGRGTDMATSLANDVFSYCTKRGSPVFLVRWTPRVLLTQFRTLFFKKSFK